jgi:uncharacterized protein
MAHSNQLIIIQTTPFCNIDCRYCYLPYRSDKTRITPEILERVFQQLFSSQNVADPINILWHAGEPLSVPVEFYRSAFEQARRINQAYGRNYIQSIQTNATLINEDWIDLFRSYKVNVAVSIDGPAFIHDRQRVTRAGKGTHADVMRGIRQLRDSGIPFGAIAVLTNFSLDYPDEIFDFLVESGIRGIGFNMDEVEGINKRSSYTHESENIISRYKIFMKRIMERMEANKGVVVVREFNELIPFFVQNPPPILVNNTTVPYLILNFDCRGNFSTFCPELVGTQSVDYGNFIMGNILSDDLHMLVDNPVFQRVNQEIQLGVEQCKNTCKYWEICKGGSPSAKYFEHGRFDATETLTCRVTRMALGEAMLEHLEEKMS